MFIPFPSLIINWPWGRLLIPFFLIIGLATINPLDIKERSKAVSFDWLTRIFPFEPDPAIMDQLLFVDIDEDSLNAIGQWPWPRQITAELISRLQSANPLVIGLDILMPEPDRFTPDALHDLTGADKDLLASILPDGDATLADALSESATVTAFALLPDKTNSPPHNIQNVAHIGIDLEEIPSASGLLMNIPILHKSKGSGFVSLTHGLDHIVRHVPLLARHDEQILPSLSLEMLRVAQSSHGHVFKSAHIRGHATGYIRTGAVVTSTDASGQIALHHGYSQNIPRLSASIIMDRDNAEWMQQVNNALIIIGSSANGLKDHHATPLEPSIAGSYIHLGIIAQILSGRVIYQSQYLDRMETTGLLLVSCILSFALYRLHMRWMIGGYAIALISPVLLHSYGFLYWGWLGNPVMDMICLTCIGGYDITIRAIKEEKRRQKLKSAFNHYLSPSMVRELELSRYPPQLGGEKRILTIMFMDIRGFTALSDQWRDQPDQLTLFINSFMDAMSEIVLSHGATLDKYIGDAIMAFWNAPIDQPDHADRAIACGRDMLAQLPDINARLKAEIDLPHDLDIGIGIATGMVVVGNMGSRLRFSYSCLGDAVNIAARLESMIKKTGMALSVAESTIKAAGAGTDLIKVGTLPVRGKQDPVIVYSMPPD